MSNIYVQILCRAHPLIAISDPEHVCVAISFAAEEMGYPYDYAGPAGRLRNWIRGSLGRHDELYSWLRDEHGISPNDLTYKNLRQYRLDWIIFMIEQVKEWE